LPTWIAWYAQQLPLWFQKASCAGMFAIELGAPFLIFAPRRLRFCGGGAIAFLQILILLTGNYTFFNLLTLALCLLLLDDFALEKIIPVKLRHLLSFNAQKSGGASSLSRPAVIPASRLVSSLAPPVMPLDPRLPGAAKQREDGSTFGKSFRWPKAIIVPLAVVVTAIYLYQMTLLFGARPVWFLPVAIADSWLEPLRTFNSYGLFAVMTTARREIIVEGSDDGVKWLPYEFKYKPGDVNRRPAFVAPHQPRLDWQMWFAALGDYQQNPWFVNFCIRLLQGSPDVLGLLEKNPFPDHPPRYVRAGFYDYRFTDFAGRRALGLRSDTGVRASSPQAGAWWKRERIGEYLPAISLSDLEKN
jgi:hypothetical protein